MFRPDEVPAVTSAPEGQGLQAGSSRTEATITQLRLRFLGMALVVVIIGSLLSWRSWNVEKQHELLYLSSLVELTGNALDGYFSRQFRLLGRAGAEILSAGYPQVTPESRQVLIHLKANEPDFEIGRAHV